jgi:hypothetical protein
LNFWSFNLKKILPIQIKAEFPFSTEIDSNLQEQERKKRMFIGENNKVGFLHLIVSFGFSFLEPKSSHMLGKPSPLSYFPAWVFFVLFLLLLFFETGSSYVAQAVFKLTLLLSQPFKC